MGENVVETQVRDILTQLSSVLRQVKSDNEAMERRIRVLEDQLAKERELRQCAEDAAERNRRFAQKLYAQLHPPTQEEIEFWRNAKREDFTMSSEEFLAIVDELENEL